MILGQRTVQRLRATPGTRGADGRWVAGAFVSAPILAGVQPMPARVRAALPEGLRERDGRVLFTRADVQPASQFSGAAADRFLIDGVMFEAIDVETWPAVIAHNRVVVVRVQE